MREKRSDPMSKLSYLGLGLEGVALLRKLDGVREAHRQRRLRGIELALALHNIAIPGTNTRVRARVRVRECARGGSTRQEIGNRRYLKDDMGTSLEVGEECRNADQ